MESYLQGQEQPFGVWINDHGESVVSYMVINWVYQKLNPMTKGGGHLSHMETKAKKIPSRYQHIYGTRSQNTWISPKGSIQILVK